MLYTCVSIVHLIHTNYDVVYVHTWHHSCTNQNHIDFLFLLLDYQSKPINATHSMLLSRLPSRDGIYHAISYCVISINHKYFASPIEIVNQMI